MLLTTSCAQLKEPLGEEFKACAPQYYAFVEEKQKVHCLNTLFSKVRPLVFEV
jgi:hypothetical protein